VRIRGDVSPEAIKKLQKGIKLEDGIARFNQVTDAGGSGSNHWYHVIVTEGRNRLVRRLWEALGFTVSRLIRIRFGPIYLPAGLRRGKYAELSDEEIAHFTQMQNADNANSR
jgi:16S rRNA uridine-516 pseudouridylate synthase and related pseudouridylate synthases